jgi:hypothetical protein
MHLRGSGTARLMLPADPEMIAAVAAMCAAETACCPHARFLLEVTAGQVILAVEAARIPPAQGRSRHYLAGRLDGVQITTIIGYGDELLVSLATRDAPLAAVFSITATTCSLTRVRRWHDESTPLRAYRSHDGAIMLADPALGGNAPCGPPVPDTYHARHEATPHDHSPTEDK